MPLDRTDPGFDLTELLNGFRPLFEVLQPADVNQLASSLVQVLQGEGGTVEQLLQQTTQLTTYVADRDAVIGEVLTNLTPVLEHLQGRGTEIESTVLELRRLMEGLAKDRHGDRLLDRRRRRSWSAPRRRCCRTPGRRWCGRPSGSSWWPTCSPGPRTG